MDKDKIFTLKVNELKDTLKNLGLNTKGRKTTLQDRLIEHFELEEELEEEEVENEDEENVEVEEEEEQIEYEFRKEENSIFTLRDIQESLEYFDGCNYPKIEKWVQDFEHNATIVKWNSLQKFIYAKQLIKGTAQVFLRGQPCINNFEQLKTSLLNEFGEKHTAIEIHKKLQNRHRKYNEPLVQYLYSLIEIAQHAKIDDKSIIEYFIEGINDSRQNKTILYEANTLSELKQKIKIYEKIKIKDKTLKYRNTNFNNSEIKKCSKCPHLNNHDTVDCKILNNLCFKCGKKGHKAIECLGKNTPKKEDKITIKPNPRHNNNYNYSNNKNENKKDEQDIQFESKHLAIAPIQILKNIKINNIEFQAILDTGSDISFITKTVYNSLRNVGLFPNTTVIKGVGQGRFETIGFITTRTHIDNISFIWTFYVAKDDDVIGTSILGSDILRIVDINLSQDGATFFLKEEQDISEDALYSELLGTPSTNIEQNSLLKAEFETLCLDRTIETDVTNELNIGKLSKEDRSKLNNLVNDYKPIQKESVNISMKIILTDDIPIYHRPRRLTIEEKNFVENQVKEWLKLGIIKQSYSEYASPIVIVPKKDGTKRLCCDYRKLNDKTIKDNYPMVLIDDVLSKLQNSKVYTTLDLKNGFFHVPIEPNSQKYTSFVTHNNQYEFTKAPFGLTNSPAIFCRYITAIFHELIQSNTLIIYMDDIVIPSHTVEENLQSLTTILKIASNYGLEINWKKCQFAQTQILFLGYIIENGTIKPSIEKTKAVKNFPIPNDIKSLQRFLGLTSYFRRFIQNYAIIAKPLTDLLRKNTEFILADEEIIAIEQLKSALTQSPVLNIFNPQAETEIHTDASMYGYGATLFQKNSEDQKFHPIEYMSRKTSGLEQKYHSYELEVLAVIEALKKWRCYVLGIHIKIITDCHAFTQTIKKKEVPARISRWIIFLQDFDYEITFRSANRLRHVDALSRAHSLLIQSPLKHCISEAQKQDEWTKTIRQLLTQGKHEDFFIKNDLLYKDNDKELIVIPASMEKEIIEMAHRQGHISTRKTIDIIQKDFYIQNITGKVTNIVKNCIQCIISLAKAGKKEGFLNPIEKTDQPLHTYHIDHVGPLENTKKQYNHILAIVDAFSKFTWLYPTKSTGTEEVINTLEKQSAIFGNPYRIITDRGTAFTSIAFQEYCKNQNIKHNLITTGVPRENGQVERIHKIVISLLTKLGTVNSQNWYKHINKVQQTINNTVNRSTKTTPFRILTGLDMKINGLDEIRQLLTEEQILELDNSKDIIRKTAKENIMKIQEENRKNFNKHRKKETVYKLGDLVAIKRTQFGTGLKIKPKFLGPYKITKTKRCGRYELEKVGQTEGPNKTTTIAENMKRWRTASESYASQDNRM